MCVFTQRFETTKFLAVFLLTVLVFNKLTHIRFFFTKRKSSKFLLLNKSKQEF